MRRTLLAVAVGCLVAIPVDARPPGGGGHPGGGGGHPGGGFSTFPGGAGGGAQFRGFSPIVPTNAVVGRQSALPLIAPRVSPILGRGLGYGGIGWGGGFGWGGYGYGWGDPYYGGYYTPSAPIQINSYTVNIGALPTYGGGGLTPLPALLNEHPTIARLELRIPGGAEVWVQGKKVEFGGTAHTFESPELKPDESFTFNVRVAWKENGKEVEEKRTVTMKPGDFQSLQFIALPPATTRVEK